VGHKLRRTQRNARNQIDSGRILPCSLPLAQSTRFLWLCSDAAQNSLPSAMYVYTLRSTQIAPAIVCGVGARAVWHERASMRFRRIGWPMAASLMSLLLGRGIPAMVYFWGDRSNFLQSNRAFAIPAAMGVLGVIVFRRHRTSSDTFSAS
jgi:hypothetical protein